MHSQIHLPIAIWLVTFAALTIALPAPFTPSTSGLSLLQLQSETHCGVISCPNGDQSGHAFCQALGCDYCLAVPSPPAGIKFECDGLRGGRQNRSSVARVNTRYGTVVKSVKPNNGSGRYH